MIAQLAGGVVTAGSAGGRFSRMAILSGRDRASKNDRKITGMTKLLLSLLTLSLAFNAYQWDLNRPWNGTSGFEHMTDKLTPFQYSHRWRMHHQDFSYKVDDAPSMDEARARMVQTMIREFGYRLPKWWELSRRYEIITEDFREEVELAEGRK
jgi:hypothetical protein